MGEKPTAGSRGGRVEQVVSVTDKNDRLEKGGSENKSSTAMATDMAEALD